MDMAIKSVVTIIAFLAVLFLCRFLVALLKESALANRRARTNRLVVRSDERVYNPGKLSRLKMEHNEIRLIPRSQHAGFRGVFFN
jgi:hypothetical protein